MKRQKVFSIIAFICYFIFVVAGASIAISSAADLITLPREGGGIGSAVSAFAMTLLLILGIAYAAFGAVPLILKGIHIAVKKSFLTYICILFDVAFNVLHAALVVSAMIDSGFADPASMILPAALLLLSVVSLASNLLSLKAPKDKSVSA